MLSVLIVDDEVITRKGLRTHIDWEKLSIGTIYDSGNAREALQIVAECKPDIILSDVNMPGMNGIEMCREIRKLHSACQILFLSGYSDKEYLRGAISLEAVDYVEKPIDIAEVEEALQRACAKQQRQLEEKEKLVRLENENYSLTVRRLIERMILPTAASKWIQADLQKINLPWSSMQEFFVVLFRLGESRVGEQDVTRAIKEQFQGVSYLYTRKEAKHLLFVCAFPTQAINSLVERLAQYVSAQRKQMLYCAVGDPVLCVEQVYESYQSAVIKLQQMTFWNRTGFVYEHYFAEKPLQFDEQIFGEFLSGMKQYREDMVVLAEEKLYAFMLLQQGSMVSSVKGIYFRFVEALFQNAQFTAGNDEASDAGMVGMIWEKLHELETLKKCQAYLKEETEGFFQNVKELAENNRTIISVIAYIQTNYQEAELGLEEIAEHVYLSQNYLSGLFRRKMGKTITQYIVDVRMDQAKTLLRNRSLKLYDVAERVGYRDANYFTKIFKKSVGITPSEYREKYNQ